MKVAIIGSRGIPARYGGFETFVEHLAADLAMNGYEVTVVNEKGNGPATNSWKGVRIKESAYKKCVHPVWFYWDSLRMTVGKVDIVLVCGVGGAMFYPMYHSPKTQIITNVDGLEHLRSKFSRVKKSYVKMAQRLTRRYSKCIVADAAGVGEFWLQSLNTPPDRLRVIEYGADPPFPIDEKHLEKWNLKRNGYYLVVARLVPENHIRELIEGFVQTATGRQLVIVGGKDNSSYVKSLLKYENHRMLFTGGIYNKQELDSLRAGAFAYLHGHSVGGTNPSLLEAMAAGCICICHDNRFNREVTEGNQFYFRLPPELSREMELLEQRSHAEFYELKQRSVHRVQQFYSWSRICSTYRNLFEELHG